MAQLGGTRHPLPEGLPQPADPAGWGFELSALAGEPRRISHRRGLADRCASGGDIRPVWDAPRPSSDVYFAHASPTAPRVLPVGVVSAGDGEHTRCSAAKPLRSVFALYSVISSRLGGLFAGTGGRDSGDERAPLGRRPGRHECDAPKWQPGIATASLVSIRPPGIDSSGAESFVLSRQAVSICPDGFFISDGSTDRRKRLASQRSWAELRQLALHRSTLNKKLT